MKMNKLIVLVSMIGLLAGCATTGPNTQDTVNKVSLVLKTTANAAVVLAIKDDPNNKKFVQLAVTTLDQFLLDGNYQPGALVAALAPVIKELKKPEINLAVNTALNLYAGLYGDYVKDKISGNENAKVLLTALRDGAATGLP